MEICKNQYESDGLLVRIVDTEKSWKDSVDYCQQFGEQLAPINNWKRLNDTLDQLEDCYKSDVDGLKEFRINDKYRVGLSIGNRVRSWSDGTLLDLDEQKSLFFKDVAPNTDGNTFFIENKFFNKLVFDSYYNDTFELSFLCSKNKLIPTTTELATISKYEPTISTINGTDKYLGTTASTSLFIVIGTISGFVILLVIVYIIYKLIRKKSSPTVFAANLTKQAVSNLTDPVNKKWPNFTEDT